MTLFATRAVISLRPDRVATPEYRVHQHVADLFGQAVERPYLYRVMKERPGGQEVFVLSTRSPIGIDALPVRPTGATVHVESKPIAPVLTAGAVYDFDLRVNATASRDGRRLDVWDARRDIDASMETVYGDWLCRKLGAAAEVLDVAVVERRRIRPATRAANAKSITFVAADLRGRLRVSDPDALIGLMAMGVGRAKAFGCGLLCLSRPGTAIPQTLASPIRRALHCVGSRQGEAETAGPRHC